MIDREAVLRAAYETSKRCLDDWGISSRPEAMDTTVYYLSGVSDMCAELLEKMEAAE